MTNYTNGVELIQLPLLKCLLGFAVKLCDCWTHTINILNSVKRFQLTPGIFLMGCNRCSSYIHSKDRLRIIRMELVNFSASIMLLIVCNRCFCYHYTWRMLRIIPMESHSCWMLSSCSTHNMNGIKRVQLTLCLFLIGCSYGACCKYTRIVESYSKDTKQRAQSTLFKCLTGCAMLLIGCNSGACFKYLRMVTSYTHESSTLLSHCSSVQYSFRVQLTIWIESSGFSWHHLRFGLVVIIIHGWLQIIRKSNYMSQVNVMLHYRSVFNSHYESSSFSWVHISDS